MERLSRLQKKAGMGRLLSAVTRRAEVYGSPTFFTHTLRVSFQGFRKAMYLPSGEICAPAISGLPKNSSRSSSGGSPAAALAGAFGATAGAVWAAAGRASAAKRSARITVDRCEGMVFTLEDLTWV